MERRPSGIERKVAGFNKFLHMTEMMIIRLLVLILLIISAAKLTKLESIELFKRREVEPPRLYEKTNDINRVPFQDLIR